ncbi:MAG TPA: hypothetical protein VHO00_01470 [Actinomycetes bacterium]|jgi:hypothetical protein|nr:hypothetical protein [Actinomycetes bacterium]
MSSRFAAVLATTGYRSAATSAPAEVAPERFRLAVIEDTYEVLAGLQHVSCALALCPGDQPAAESLVWPGTPVLRILPGSSAHQTMSVLDGLAVCGADQAAVVAGDVPDLPGLLVAKLFRALGSHDVAVAPAANGGLVAMAGKLPVPDWLPATGVGLDTVDALEILQRAAPGRGALSVGPGWRRLRRVEDLGYLDPGLPGWEATRALLAQSPGVLRPSGEPSSLSGWSPLGPG